MTDAPLALTRLGTPGAPPALLAHCFLGHRGTWARLLARMEGPLDALAFDLPGHGQSPMPAVADDFHAEVTALVPGLLDQIAPGGTPALGIGHSFGGAVLLRHALLNPASIAGLVLIEPVFFAAAAGMPAYDTWLVGEAPIHAAIAEGRLEDAARAFLAENGDGTPWERIPERQRSLVQRQLWLMTATMPGLGYDTGRLMRPGLMEGFDRPVLLLAGSHSPPIFGAVCEALAARLPHAQMAVVEGAAHMLPITHAAAVARLIDTWRLQVGV